MRKFLYLWQGAEASIREYRSSIRCLKNKKMGKYVQMRMLAILTLRAVMLQRAGHLGYCSGATWESVVVGSSCPGRDYSNGQSCKTFVGKSTPKNLQSGDNKTYFS